MFSGLCLFLPLKYGFASPVILALLPRGELGCFVCVDLPAGVGRCLGHSRKEETAPYHTSGFTSPLTSPVSSRNTCQVSLQAQYICIIPSASALRLEGSPEVAFKKSDLPSIPRADMGVWEGPGVPRADLETSVWLPRGWRIKSTMYLHLPRDRCVEARQHSQRDAFPRGHSHSCASHTLFIYSLVRSLIMCCSHV